MKLREKNSKVRHINQCIKGRKAVQRKERPELQSATKKDANGRVGLDMILQSFDTKVLRNEYKRE